MPGPQNRAKIDRFTDFFGRNQPMVRAYSLQMASNEKLNMYESLGGNELAYRPYRMTSGWSMTLKMEQKLTVLQVFLEKPINSAGP